MAEFSIGQVVQLNDGRFATIRFIGETGFQVGEWIGVELEDDSGKNDGSVRGERYFDCEPGHGMFVKPAALALVADQPPPPKPAPIATKKTSRPSSMVAATGVGARRSSVVDTATGKRMSMNAASPSPATRSRPSSMLRVSSLTAQHFIILIESNSRLPNLPQSSFRQVQAQHQLLEQELPRTLGTPP